MQTWKHKDNLQSFLLYFPSHGCGQGQEGRMVAERDPSDGTCYFSTWSLLRESKKSRGRSHAVHNCCGPPFPTVIRMKLQGTLRAVHSNFIWTENSELAATAALQELLHSSQDNALKLKKLMRVGFRGCSGETLWQQFELSGLTEHEASGGIYSCKGGSEPAPF